MRDTHYDTSKYEVLWISHKNQVGHKWVKADTVGKEATVF